MSAVGIAAAPRECDACKTVQPVKFERVAGQDISLCIDFRACNRRVREMRNDAD